MLHDHAFPMSTVLLIQLITFSKIIQSRQYLNLVTKGHCLHKNVLDLQNTLVYKLNYIKYILSHNYDHFAIPYLLEIL